MSHRIAEPGIRCAAAILLSVIAAAPAAAQREAFEAELAEVREHVDDREWADACRRLEAAIEDHANEEYVLYHWTEIEDTIAHCRFWSSYERPEPEDVVAGELLSWKASTGKIKIRYRNGRGLPRAAKPEEGVEQVGDFVVTENDVFLHPLLFKGPYSIEIRGERMGPRAKLPILLVAWEWGDIFHGFDYGTAYGVAFGQQTFLLELKDGEFSSLDDCSTSMKRDRPYSFEVKVGSSSISAFYNGKLLLKEKRSKGDFGQFGFYAFEDIEEVTVAGEVEPSWIAGLIDEQVRGAWHEFRESFDPLPHVPRWLRVRVDGPSERASDFWSCCPGEMNGNRKHYLNAAAGFVDREQYDKGLEYIERVHEGSIDAETRSWLLANFLLLNGKVEEAVDHVESVCQADPIFFEGRLLRAQLAWALEPADEADVELDLLISDFPGHVESYELMAAHHLFTGRLADAERVMETAVRNGMPPRSLAVLGRNLLRSRRGPQWERTHVRETKHFVVASDLSGQASFEIANELEKFYRKYVNRVRRPREKSERKFQVYFFSGAAGYQDYCQDLFGDPAESTLGVYSPWLKQLVLWNSPDKRMVMRTVRHEGFHQYLDSITSEAPVWLNEGMAEYFEQAQLVRGRWKDAQVNAEHVAVLQATVDEWTPLEKFVHQQDAAFRARSGLHYPQAWALVHYLFNGDSRGKKIADRLLDELVSGATREEALERAFGGVDWDAFEEDFRDHVESLDESERARR